MRYIVSESQYRVLLEDLDSSISWIKRRANHDTMSEYIDLALDSESEPCENYESETDFAEGIISHAVKIFLWRNKQFYSSEKYDQYLSILVDKCKELFFDSLSSDYRFICYSNYHV